MIPIEYIPNFVDNPTRFFEGLSKELAWVHRDTTPRHEYYSNDFPVPYTYGKGDFARTYEPQPMHPLVRELRSKLEVYTGTIFEVCFLNRYLNQWDQLGWHADDSPEMDDARPIAIISLGVERDIMFRDNAGVETIRKRLQNGSLCLMKAGMQDTHQHRIPKAGFVCGERISLTFRGYINQVAFDAHLEEEEAAHQEALKRLHDQDMENIISSE